MYPKQVFVRFEDSKITVAVNPGANLLDAALKAGILLPATCGGQGECGECRLIVLDGLVSPLTREECESLTEAERASGMRLACTTRVFSSVKVLG